MNQPLVGITGVSQLLVITKRADKLLGEMIAIMSLINLMMIVLSTLKSQENQNAKNWLSFKNCLSQENPKIKN